MCGDRGGKTFGASVPKNPRPESIRRAGVTFVHRPRWLSASAYCHRERFRPTCAPCSAQEGKYPGTCPASRGRKSSWPLFADNSIIHNSTAFLPTCGKVCGQPDAGLYTVDPSPHEPHCDLRFRRDPALPRRAPDALERGGGGRRDVPRVAGAGARDRAGAHGAAASLVVGPPDPRARGSGTGRTSSSTTPSTRRSTSRSTWARSSRWSRTSGATSSSSRARSPGASPAGGSGARPSAPPGSSRSRRCRRRSSAPPGRRDRRAPRGAVADRDLPRGLRGRPLARGSPAGAEDDGRGRALGRLRDRLRAGARADARRVALGGHDLRRRASSG